MNALEVLDAELTRIELLPPPTTKTPLFLWTKDGHQIRIRFLMNLSEVVVMKRHNKYSSNPGERVNAICGKETDQPCSYCELAEHDHELEAHLCWYLPTYIYWIAVTKDENGKTLKDATGQPKPVQLTYKSKDEEVLPVKGFRILELPLTGAMGKVLSTLRNYAKDADYHFTIIENDFVLEHQNVIPPGKKKATKTVTLTVKPAKPMADEVKECIPTFDGLRQQIVEALTPVVSNAENGIENDNQETADEDTPF